jgi:hypothetical protein
LTNSHERTPNKRQAHNNNIDAIVRIE